MSRILRLILRNIFWMDIQIYRLGCDHCGRAFHRWYFVNEWIEFRLLISVLSTRIFLFLLNCLKLIKFVNNNIIIIRSKITGWQNGIDFLSASIPRALNLHKRPCLMYYFYAFLNFPVETPRWSILAPYCWCISRLGMWSTTHSFYLIILLLFSTMFY